MWSPRSRSVGILCRRTNHPVKAGQLQAFSTNMAFHDNFLCVFKSGNHSRSLGRYVVTMRTFSLSTSVAKRIWKYSPAYLLKGRASCIIFLYSNSIASGMSRQASRFGARAPKASRFFFTESWLTPIRSIVFAEVTTTALPAFPLGSFPTFLIGNPEALHLVFVAVPSRLRHGDL